MAIEIHTDFNAGHDLARVDIEPGRGGGQLYVTAYDGTTLGKCLAMSLAEFDLVAAEVAAYRRLIAEPAHEAA